MQWLDDLSRLFGPGARHPWMGPLIGVLAVMAGTLIVWLLLLRIAARSRRSLQELLILAQSSPDPIAEVALAQRRLTAMRLAVNAAKYVLFASSLIAMISCLGFQLGGLVLPAGFFGAALGLGAQFLVRDIVAGFFIVFEGQFSVNDVVEINGTLGTVEEVGLRVTRVRDTSGVVHFFPNGGFTSVAKFPQRHVSLVMLVPLADAAGRAQAAAVAKSAIESFGNRFRAFAGSVELDDNSEADADCLRYPLAVHPERLAITREKLAGRVTSALRAANIAIEADGEVVLVEAPTL